MIKGQEVFKCIDPKANFLAQEVKGDVWWYEERPEKGYYLWVYKSKASGSLGKVQIEEFAGKDWQDCILEKEQDPKEWIGCLCWCWNGNEEDKKLRVLEDYDGRYVYRITQNEERFCYSKNCRPVKKSEVKFFEEKE